MLTFPAVPGSQSDNHLRNGVREALLQAGLGKGLLVVEGLYHLNIQPESWLTFADIYELLSENFGTSYQLVYQGLQDSGIFQRRKSAGEAHRRGAKPYLYRVPHPDELLAEFAPGAETTPSDALEKEDLKSLTRYRMALHRQLYVRRWCRNGGRGFVMSRGLMADRLGVSERTIRTYDKNLGHSHDPNYREERIGWQNWDNLPRFKHNYSATGKRQPSRQWLKVVDWDRSGHTTLMPLVKFLAYRELTAGKAVYRVERLPNTYYPYQKPDISQFDSWDAASHYFAEQKARHAAGLFQDHEGRWFYQRE